MRPDPHFGHRAAPTVKNPAVEADEAVVARQPVVEHLEIQGAVGAEPGLETTFQWPAPDQIAVMPLGVLGTCHCVGVIPQELDDPALGAAELRVVERVPVIQCTVDERANHAHCGRLGRVVVIEYQIAAAGAATGEQEVAPDLVVVVGEAVGETWADRRQQQTAGLDRLAGHHVDTCVDPAGFPVVVEILDRADPAPGIAEDARHLGVGADLAAPAGRCVVEQGGTRTALGTAGTAETAAEAGVLTGASAHRGLGQDRARHPQRVKAELLGGLVDARGDRMFEGRWKREIGARP